jgi:hypothetical protein
LKKDNRELNNALSFGLSIEVQVAEGLRWDMNIPTGFCKPLACCWGGWKIELGLERLIREVARLRGKNFKCWPAILATRVAVISPLRVDFLATFS